MNPFIVAGEKQKFRAAAEFHVTELWVCQTLWLQTDLQTSGFQRQTHDLPANTRYNTSCNPILFLSSSYFKHWGAADTEIEVSLPSKNPELLKFSDVNPTVG